SASLLLALDQATQAWNSGTSLRSLSGPVAQRLVATVKWTTAAPDGVQRSSGSRVKRPISWTLLRLGIGLQRPLKRRVGGRDDVRQVGRFTRRYSDLGAQHGIAPGRDAVGQLAGGAHLHVLLRLVPDLAHCRLGDLVSLEPDADLRPMDRQQDAGKPAVDAG